MELLVVRHGHAGSKDRWAGDDRLRPLSDRGRREARALVDLLARYHPARVVSSPLARCLQTVAPLAAVLGLTVEESEALGPQGDREASRLLRSFASAARPVVVCTHGETIEALQRRLVRPGELAFGPGSAHEKGSVWLLQSKGSRFTSATYLQPSVPLPDGRAPRGGRRGESAAEEEAGAKV